MGEKNTVWPAKHKNEEYHKKKRKNETKNVADSHESSKKETSKDLEIEPMQNMEYAWTSRPIFTFDLKSSSSLIT